MILKFKQFDKEYQLMIDYGYNVRITPHGDNLIRIGIHRGDDAPLNYFRENEYHTLIQESLADKNPSDLFESIWSYPDLQYSYNHEDVPIDNQGIINLIKVKEILIYCEELIV